MDDLWDGLSSAVVAILLVLVFAWAYRAYMGPPAYTAAQLAAANPSWTSIEVERVLEHRVWVGMSADMALASIGRPGEVNRTVTRGRAWEQWVYSDGYLYFENGILVSWQD